MLKLCSSVHVKNRSVYFVQFGCIKYGDTTNTTDYLASHLCSYVVLSCLDFPTIRVNVSNFNDICNKSETERGLLHKYFSLAKWRKHLGPFIITVGTTEKNIRFIPNHFIWSRSRPFNISVFTFSIFCFPKT